LSGTPSLKLSLLGILRIEFELEVLTGLLIQAPQHLLATRIGGADRFPMTIRKSYRVDGSRVEEIEVPFIPGSSLKGRMRSLLEVALNKKLYSTDLKIFYHARLLAAKAPMTLKEYIDDIEKRCEVDDLFGSPSIHFSELKEKIEQARKESSGISADEMSLFSTLAPTRLLVDDLYPSEDYVRKLYQLRGSVTIDDFVEDKPENRIDRITSAADPREMVRVRPGVEFSGAIRMLIFDRDLDGKSGDVLLRYLKALVLSMRLVEETYLGSCGSRGYGRVRFKNIKLRLLKVDPESLALSEATIGSESYPSLQKLAEDIENVAKNIAEELKGSSESKG